MPIATYKPEVRSPVKQNLPKVEPAGYKSVVVDDKQTPLNSLIAYIEGAPWTVSYYSQIISEDNDIKDLDPGQVSIYQQYARIDNLELRVSTALTSTQDTDNSLVTVTGNALIYPFLVPNVGDVFVAEAGAGRKGIYRLTNVERKTFNRDSAFLIDYELIGYLDTIRAVYEDLEKKVTRKFVFSKDRLIEGGVPTLTTDEHNKYVDLGASWKELCAYYFKSFFSRDVSTLLLPGQQAWIYDSFLVNYVLKLVDTFDALEIRNIKNLTREGDPFMEQMQFWNVMEQRNEALLPYCNRYMGVVNTLNFGSDPMMQGLRYSRVQYVIYPKDGDHSIFSEPFQPVVKNQYDPATSTLRTIMGDAPAPAIKVQALEEILQAKTAGGSIADLLRNNHIEANKTVQMVGPVFQNSAYVLSDKFYDKTADQTLIETLTMDYISGRALSIDNIHKLVQDYRRWGRLEQFYYIPILLTLIKSVRKGLY